MELGIDSSDRPRRFHRTSLLVIGGWTLWLCLTSSWHLPAVLSLPGTGFVLLFGAFWWTAVEAAGFLLLMSFIYGAFSLTPSGFYWLSCFIVYLGLRFLSFRFSMRTALQLAGALFFTTLALNIVQLLILAHIDHASVLSWKIVGALFSSAALQAGVGFLLSKPLMILFEAK